MKVVHMKSRELANNGKKVRLDESLTRLEESPGEAIGAESFITS